MKKILMTLLIILSVFIFFGCDKENKIYQYELVKDHLYSDDISMSIPYLNDGKYERFESKLSIALEGFINFLDIDAPVSKVKDSKYITANTNEKTVIITSKVDDNTINCYINEDGKIITSINEDIYTTDSSVLDYSKFCTLTKLSDVEKKNTVKYSYGIYSKDTTFQSMDIETRYGINLSTYARDDLYAYFDEYLDNNPSMVESAILCYQAYLYAVRSEELMADDAYVIELPQNIFGKKRIPFSGHYFDSIVSKIYNDYIRYSSNINVVYINNQYMIYTNDKVYLVVGEWINPSDFKSFASFNCESLNTLYEEFARRYR